MKLIRRRQSSTLHRSHKIAKLAVRVLVLQRMARKFFKTHRRIRRLPLVFGVGAAVLVLLRKLRGGDQGGPETWTAPPAATTPPAPIQTAGGGGTQPESPVETAATGTSPADTEPEAGGAPEAADAGAPAATAAEPEVAAAAAATDAGTTGGGSEAAADDSGDEGDDAGDAAAATIGDDLAAAAGGDAADNGDASGDNEEIPAPGEADLRAPAPEESS